MIFKYWKLYPMEFGNLKSKIKCFSLVENYYPMKFRYLKSLNLWFSKVENYYPMKFRNLKSWNLWFSELEKFKKSKWEHCYTTNGMPSSISLVNCDSRIKFRQTEEILDNFYYDNCVGSKANNLYKILH